ncbi:MAG: glutamate formimidoyltransferase [Synergistaceae bacterium]|jgi:glutamate formiminotransferase|nr:glutamate formimidoyltransferase [Synergistaceae bacterium]
MNKLIECVPNFSEGRRQSIINSITDAARAVPGVKVLDCSSDSDHNRSVLTFVGPPDAVKDAAFACCAKAASLIDMEQHRGGHPRIGATDVIPFVPVSGATMEECVAIAHDLGKEIADRLSIPVYFYEAAALRSHMRSLPDVRKGEYEGLKEEIKKTPLRAPDLGPHEMHPTAGATVVGARPFLVAFNINLDTADVGIAKKIAQTIRAARGGYVNCRAIGVESSGKAQVSINMTDYTATPLHRVFETVKSEAARWGVNVSGSEIVGLTPMQALLDAAAFYLRLEGFSASQVLESMVWE